MSLKDFKALSFDCYGTLIDWEDGIYEALDPILNKLPLGHRYLTNKVAVLERFNSLQGALEVEQPTLPYNEVLAACYGKVAQEEGVETSEQERSIFGSSVGKWRAFPDTVVGLQRLQKYYKLMILSNVDRENVRATLAGPLDGVRFDAVYTAQDIGSYKPNHNNFAYLVDHLKADFDLDRSQLLHTAKSLPVDHVPAKQLGLTSAWISRGNDGVSAMGGNLAHFEGKVAYLWRFPSIGAMADAVEREFQES